MLDFSGPWTTFGLGTLRDQTEQPATTAWTRSVKLAHSQLRSGEASDCFFLLISEATLERVVKMSSLQVQWDSYKHL